MLAHPGDPLRAVLRRADQPEGVAQLGDHLVRHERRRGDRLVPVGRVAEVGIYLPDRLGISSGGSSRPACWSRWSPPWSSPQWTAVGRAPWRRSVRRCPRRRYSGEHEASMTTGVSQGRSGVADDPAPIACSGHPPARGSSDGLPLPADAAADLQLAEIGRALASGEGRPSRARPPRAPGAPDADRAVHRSRGHRLPARWWTSCCTTSRCVSAWRWSCPTWTRWRRPGRRAGQPGRRWRRPADRPPARRPRAVRGRRPAARARWKPARSGSAALQALREYVLAITAPAFVAIEAELPALRETLGQARSVTIGINLRRSRAESATILGLSVERIEGARTLLARLLGGPEAVRGITPLQHGGSGGWTAEPPDPRPGPAARRGRRGGRSGARPSTPRRCRSRR